MHLFLKVLFFLIFITPTSMALELEDTFDLTHPLLLDEEETKIYFYVSTADIDMIEQNINKIFEKHDYWSRLAKLAGFKEISKALTNRWRWNFTLLGVLKSKESKIIEIKKLLFDGAYGGNLTKIDASLRAFDKKRIKGTTIINHQGQTAAEVAKLNRRSLTALHILNFNNVIRLDRISKKFPSSEELFEGSRKKPGTLSRTLTQKKRGSMKLDRKLKSSPKKNKEKRSASPSPEKFIVSNKRPSHEEIIEEDLMELFSRKSSGKHISTLMATGLKYSPTIKRRNFSLSPQFNFRQESAPSPAMIRAENLAINIKLVISSFSNDDFSKINEDILSHEVFLKLIAKIQQKNQEENEEENEEEEIQFDIFEGTMLGFVMQEHQAHSHWHNNMWVLLDVMQLTRSIDEIDEELRKYYADPSNDRRQWFCSILPKGFKDTYLLLKSSEDNAERARKMGQEALALALEEQRYLFLFDKKKLSTAVCQIANRQIMGF